MSTSAPYRSSARQKLQKIGDVTDLLGH